MIGMSGIRVFADNHMVDYLEIGSVNHRSLPKINEKVDEEQIKNTVNDPYAFFEQQKKENFNPSARDKRDLSFKLLQNAHENGARSLTNQVIDTTTWGDLNLLYGSEKHPEIYLGSLIDRTRTDTGRAYLFSLLAQPTDDVSILKQRQDLARYWVEHHEEAGRIDAMLGMMPLGEAQMLLFGKALGIVQAIRGDFFQYSLLGSFNDTLNENEIFLDAISTVNRAAVYPGAVLRIFVPLFFMTYGILRLSGHIDGTKVREEDSKLANLFSPDLCTRQVTRYTSDFISMGGALYKPVFDRCDSAWMQAMVALCIGGKLILTTKEYIQTTHLSLQWGKLLHQKLRLLANYVKLMRKMHKHVLTHPELQCKLRYFNHLHEFFTSTDQQLQHLLGILESSTFNSEAKLFYREGRVLVAYKLLLEKDIQDCFASAMVSISEIDASLSVAKLVKEHDSAPVHYGFVEYLNNPTPRIELEAYWNPFVEANVVVPNSLHLGADCGIANVVVTGPNSGGKSTLLKSIALSLIMAQSLGIVPATKARITPFHYIATYMGITDDISDKASLFQAEVDRAVKLENRISKMSKDLFSFIMFDELFSGTSPDEGSAIAYATAEELGKHPHCMSVIATHFPLLTTLEYRTNRYKNYHVAVDVSGDIIKRFFKLDPGIAQQHIALKVARERGCTGSIIGRSQEVLTAIKETHE